jgi:uncharacterized repeat protein (TIGR03803 family)
VQDFDGANGAYPYGSLMQAADGKLYGTTNGGGNGGYGVIFSFDLSTSAYTTVKDFDYTNGGYPVGSLMQASDGKLYGTTNGGGNGGYGVIFSFDPSSSTYSKVQDYNGTNGARPSSGSAFIEARQVTTSVNSNAFCAGSSLNVAYTATGSYGSANVFTAQLSDASGSFANPVAIGNTTSATSGTIEAVIPATTTAGTGYRIRVVSSNQAVTGSDNGSDIAITALATFYQDADGDGYGNASVNTQACSAPQGYVTDNTDCDDSNASVHPGAAEVCNGLDDNCDGQIDEGVKTTFYADADGDGYGNSSSATQACSAPAGYVADNTDCDDAKASVHPGATEVCNGIDDNCDGQIDEGLLNVTYYRDADGDGYGNVAISITYCSPPTGYVTSSTDCDDGDKTKHETFQFYVDSDGDGYGAGSLLSVCAVDAATPPAGYALNNTDCDPADNTKWQSSLLYVDADGDGYTPGTETVCYGAAIPAGYRAAANGNDCDDNNAGVWRSGTLYIDSDGDGYDAGQNTVCYGSTVPAGFKATTQGTDCNDGDAAMWRSATAYIDADGDGYDNGSTTLCYGATLPTGYAATTNGSDCNDNNAAINVKTTWYRDADGDGYGNAAISTTSCSQPLGYVATNTDCNDASKTVYPGAVELCGNGIDDNCNGQIDENCGSVPRISINDVSVYESEGVAVVTISLDRVSTSAISINYATQNGTAIGSGKGAKTFDFTSASGTVTIAAGATTAQLRITITKDTIAEVSESFKVNLSLDAKNAKKATITKSSGTVTINDGIKPALTTTQPVTKTAAEEVQPLAFDVRAYPNPSPSSFTIKVSSTKRNEVISMTVTDVNGRVIEIRSNHTAGQTVQIGSGYRTGIYFVEMRQGKARTQVKVVKMAY